MSQQDLASPAENMDIERTKLTTQIPAGKGKVKQTQTGQTQIRRSINKYLQTFGPGKGTLLVEIIENLTDDDLAKEGIITITLVLSLARQVRTLTANVQNLTLLIWN